MLKNATPLRKSAPGPPNISDEHADPLQMPHAWPSFLEMPQNPHVLQILLTRCTIALPPFLPPRQNLPVLHTFDTVQNPLRLPRKTIWTFKSGPKLVFFVHFDFEMCFAPQRRALFRHLNFQKWSEHWCALYVLTWKCASHHNGVHLFDISTSKSSPEHEVLCTFWLGNVLRATTACNLSSLIWPHGSAPAALASLLFRPSGATNHWKKHSEFATFRTFSRMWIFFLRRLSLFWSAFFFSSLLCLFSSLSLPSLHIVGSLSSILSEDCRKFDFETSFG